MRKLNIGGIYKNKHGEYCRVIQKGINVGKSNFGEHNVIYANLHDNEAAYYIRPYSEFMSKINKNTNPNANQKYEFTEVSDNDYNGLFITVEGGDRVGKSYAVDEAMKMIGGIFNIIRTREPGGYMNPLAEKIREMLLDKENSDMTKTTEAYLYAAARSQHVEKTLAPLLDNYNIVLCDRYIHSSMVYQSIDSDLSANDVLDINWYATQQHKYIPDHTFVFYLEDEEELERRFMNTESTRDRIESRDIEFFKTVNRKYQEVSQCCAQGTVFHMIECSGTKEEVLVKFMKELLPIVVDYTNENNLLDYDIIFESHDSSTVHNAFGDNVIIHPSHVKYIEEPNDIKISWHVDTGVMSSYPHRRKSFHKIYLLNNESQVIVSELRLDKPEQIDIDIKSFKTYINKVLSV